MTTGAIALLLIAVLLAVRHAADHAIDPVVMDPAELGLFAHEFLSTQMG